MTLLSMTTTWMICNETIFSWLGTNLEQSVEISTLQSVPFLDDNTLDTIARHTIPRCTHLALRLQILWEVHLEWQFGWMLAEVSISRTCVICHTASCTPHTTHSYVREANGNWNDLFWPIYCMDDCGVSICMANPHCSKVDSIPKFRACARQLPTIAWIPKSFLPRVYHMPFARPRWDPLKVQKCSSYSWTPPNTLRDTWVFLCMRRGFPVPYSFLS